MKKILILMLLWILNDNVISQIDTICFSSFTKTEIIDRSLFNDSCLFMNLGSELTVKSVLILRNKKTNDCTIQIEDLDGTIHTEFCKYIYSNENYFEIQIKEQLQEKLVIKQYNCLSEIKIKGNKTSLSFFYIKEEMDDYNLFMLVK